MFMAKRVGLAAVHSNNIIVYQESCASLPLVGKGRMDPCDSLVVVHLAHQIRLIPGDDNRYLLRVEGSHATLLLYLHRSCGTVKATVRIWSIFVYDTLLPCDF